MSQWDRTGVEDRVWIRLDRDDEEPCLEAFLAGFVVDTPFSDRCERAQALTLGMTLGESAGVRDPAQALFDTAMTRIDVCQLRCAGPRQDRIVEEKPEVLVQAST